MRERNRIFALLLSLILTFTFMPSMAFAVDDTTDEDSVSVPAAEEVQEEATEDAEAETEAIEAEDADVEAEAAVEAEEAEDAFEAVPAETISQEPKAEAIFPVSMSIALAADPNGEDYTTPRELTGYEGAEDLLTPFPIAGDRMTMTWSDNSIHQYIYGYMGDDYGFLDVAAGTFLPDNINVGNGFGYGYGEGNEGFHADETGYSFFQFSYGSYDDNGDFIGAKCRIPVRIIEDPVKSITYHQSRPLVVYEDEDLEDIQFSFVQNGDYAEVVREENGTTETITYRAKVRHINGSWEYGLYNENNEDDLLDLCPSVEDENSGQIVLHQNGNYDGTKATIQYKKENFPYTSMEFIPAEGEDILLNGSDILVYYDGEERYFPEMRNAEDTFFLNGDVIKLTDESGKVTTYTYNDSAKTFVNGSEKLIRDDMCKFHVANDFANAGENTCYIKYFGVESQPFTVTIDGEELDGPDEVFWDEETDFAYSLVNSDGADIAKIVGYRGDSKVLNIPSELEGRPVAAFSIRPGRPVYGDDTDYSTITRIVLPASVIYIKGSTLRNMHGLESVEITENEVYVTIDGSLYKKTEAGNELIWGPEYPTISGDYESMDAGQAKAVTIAKLNQSVTYKFTPQTSGRYKFYSTGDYDTKGRVRTIDYVINDDDDNGNEDNFSIAFDAEAGTTYYLQARCYDGVTGSFVLHLEQDVPSDYDYEFRFMGGYSCSNRTIAVEPINQDGPYDEYFEICPVDNNNEIPEGLTFESSNNLVATVEADKDDTNACLVWYRGVKGAAVITAKYNGEEIASMNVTVKNGIKLDMTKLNIPFASSYEYSEDPYWCDAVVTYDGTVLREGFDYQLWIYPDESIARFFPEGEYYGDEYSYPYSVVITGGDVPHEHTLIRIPASEPTCMMSGNAEYWQCSECGKIFSDAEGNVETTLAEVVIPALNHDWGESTYEWSEDNSSLTASRTCQREGCGETETETVTVTSEVSKTPTCTEKGETTYTSGTFSNPGFTVQRKTEDVDALGHLMSKVEAKAATCTNDGNEEHWKCSRCGKLFKDKDGVEETSAEAVKISKLEHNWSAVTYEPTEEGFDPESSIQTVTASRTCTNENHDEAVDGPKTETETGSITKQTDAASCTAAGTVTYTVVFENKAFGTWTTTRDVESVGHSWSEVTYTWSEDNSKVTASRTCTNENHNESIDGPKTETETVSTTSEVTKPATCTEKGKTTYTSAAFNNPAFAVQSKTVEDIDALGHDWDAPAYVWSEDNKTVTATRACKRCDEAETETVGVSTEVTKAPTCEENGETTYTPAAFSNEAFKTQSPKVVADVPAIGHDWDEGQITKRATATEPGEMTYTCKRDGCNKTKTEPIAALGEDHAAVNEAAEAAIAAAETSIEDATDAEVDEALSGAETAAAAAVTAAESALTGAENDLADAEATGDAEAIAAAQAAVNAAKQDVADAEATQAKAAAVAKKVAAKRSAATAASSQAAAASQAAAGTDAAVAAAQASVTAANIAKNDADAAVAAAEAAVAAAEATGDEAVKAAANEALSAAQTAQRSAESAVIAANGTYGTAVAARNAAIAAAQTPPAPAEIIDLPTVKISKPAAAKKKITVKWKKVSKANLKKISGIQIQVATDPGFTNIVKTATAGKKKTSKAIKGLQPKTKYYVRIRAYAAGNHYSAWKSKSAKVK